MRKWDKIYDGIKIEAIKRAKKDVKSILKKNPSYKKFLKTEQHRSSIETEINSQLRILYSDEVKNKKGYQNAAGGSLCYFKSHLWDDFSERHPKDINNENLQFFAEVTLPERRKRELKNRAEFPPEKQEYFYNDLEFLMKATTEDILKHLFEIEVLENICNRNYDKELGLNEPWKKHENKTNGDATASDELAELQVKDILEDPEDWNNLLTFLKRDDVEILLEDGQLSRKGATNKKLTFIVEHLIKNRIFKSTFSDSQIAIAFKNSILGFRISSSNLRKPKYSPEPSFSTMLTIKFPPKTRKK